MKAIAFDEVARYYDLHVRTEIDLPFWVEEARRHPGRRLELMCGTGRITLALLRAGHQVTGVDYSAGLLARFREKLAAEGLAAEVLELDVRRLAVAQPYDWIYLGFHSFSELVTLPEQREVLERVHAALAPAGRFTCALHNARIRGPQLDGAWRDLGVFDVPWSGGTLVVRARYELDAATGIATGEQHYRELDARGALAREVHLPVRFALPTPEAFVRLAGEAGLLPVDAWGSYQHEPFDAETSPVFIAELRRR